MDLRRYEIKGKGRRLRNGEVKDLYSSPNIVRVIKSRRMRWAEHVALMGDRRGVCGFLVERRAKSTLETSNPRWEE